MKTEVAYVCSDCGASQQKWAGQCEACGAWNTLKKFSVPKTPLRSAGTSANTVSGMSITSSQSFMSLASSDTKPTQSTGIGFLDQMLSGGLVHGSVTLLGGEPGIGKSTLLAQLALTFANTERSVVYVTGEESPSQVRLRLGRLSAKIPESVRFFDTTSAESIASMVMQERPALVIVDSVQTIRMEGVPGEAGNPSQIKASSALITEAAKKSHVPVIFVGQVTKDGDLAGPRLLEHLVDTVAMLEGERYQTLRILRLTKHRFGTTEASSVLLMTEKGLQEMKDPSAFLIAHRPQNVSGSVLSCLLHGSRPLAVEIQALVSPSGFGTPARRVSGVDPTRVNLLLAVLAKRAGIGFSDQDVFVNAVGGVSADDPSVDVAIALALVSAKKDVPLPPLWAAFGEVGLAGELRTAQGTSVRVKELQRLGITSALVADIGSPLKAGTMKIMTAKTIKEALEKAGL